MLHYLGNGCMREMDEAGQEFTVSGVELKFAQETKTIVEDKDRSGNVLSYKWFEGANLPRYYPFHIVEKVKYFKFRPDDVYLPGFPRTGTNWTNELAQMLLNGKAETVVRLKPHLDFLTQEELDKIPSPRVLNAHLRMSEAPKDIKEKKTKIIFTLRDPKDVAVSMYKLLAGHPLAEKPYCGSFEDFLYLFIERKVHFNGIFSHWRAAEKFFDENPDVPVHFQVYEETIEDPVRSIQRLSGFLGLQRDEDLCKAIAEKCEFTTLKADKDPYTLKFSGKDIIFRQGKSGDWMNYFSDTLLEDYYRAYEEQMAGSRFYELYAQKK